MSKQLPRCSATLNDGTRCSRRVSDGSKPPVCHIHQAAAQGQSISPLTQPLAFEPLEKLRKLAAKDGSQSQMAALRLLIELEQNAARLNDEDADEPLNLEALTPEEHAELYAACQTMVRLKKVARSRPVPVELDDEDDEPPFVEPPPVAAPPPSSAAPVTDPDPEPYPLPRDQWEAAGVTEIDGVPTHDRGDEHALKILNLEIPYDEAVRAHTDSIEEARQFDLALVRQRELSQGDR